MVTEPEDGAPVQTTTPRPAPLSAVGPSLTVKKISEVDAMVESLIVTEPVAPALTAVSATVPILLLETLPDAVLLV